MKTPAKILVEMIAELKEEKRQNEHLKKLLFQVLDFSKNRAMIAEERILRDEIEEGIEK